MKRIIQKFSQGFSLAELLIVISIVALLCALSAPLLASLKESWKLRMAREKIRATVENLIALSFELQRESTLVISETSYHSSGAYLVDIKIDKELSLESNPMKFTFYPSGAVTPGSIRLSFAGRKCVITLSLRGRISEACVP